MAAVVGVLTVSDRAHGGVYEVPPPESIDDNYFFLRWSFCERDLSFAEQLLYPLFTGTRSSGCN